MTLLFMDSFDAHDTPLKYTFTPSSSPSYAHSTRYGTGSAMTPSTAAGVTRRPITASTHVKVGAAVVIDSLAAERQVFLFYSDAGATFHHRLLVSTTGALVLYRGLTQVGTSAAGLIVAGAWNYLELGGTIADAGGVGVVRLNGSVVINFTGDTRNAGTSTNIEDVQLGSGSAPTNLISYDDLYIINALGAAPNNDFLGEIVVSTIVPNGPGAQTDFTPTGSVNNWENVDELPYSLADFNSGLAIGDVDEYTMSNLPSGVGTIYGIQSNMIASKVGVGAGDLRTLVRSAGVDYPDATSVLTSTAKTYSAVRETDPATAAAWTASGVNALEAGVEVV